MEESIIEQFFQLLRHSIGATADFPGGISFQDWEEMHRIARQQSVLGVVFHAIEQTPSVRMDRRLLLRWYSEAEEIRRRNRRMDEATVQMVRRLERDGFRTCVLKGQGNALLYPARGIRIPGDIDVWLLADRLDVYRYVRSIFPDTEMLYHHLEFPLMEDVATELHFLPMFLNNPLYDRRFRKWAWRMVQEGAITQVENEFGHFPVPSREFNLVYQLAHIRHHFFDEGIGLRQLVDYYFLLSEGNSPMPHPFSGRAETDWAEMLGHLGLRKFAGALMWVLHEMMGLEEECLIVPANERLGRMLLDEVLMTGNFGQSDVRFGNLKSRSRLARLWGLLVKNVRFLASYPDEVVFGFLFRSLGQPLWRLGYQLRHGLP